MRFALLALLALLAACAADPVLLPDAGPCSSACGAGTVCQGGACVAVDSGTVDAPRDNEAGVIVDVGVDRPAAVDLGTLDTGSDAGAVDVGSDVPVDTYGACLANGIRTCDGRNVDIQGGERDGGVDSGRVYHCGGCGITCAAGEVCDRCVCAR